MTVAERLEYGMTRAFLVAVFFAAFVFTVIITFYALEIAYYLIINYHDITACVKSAT